jgi:hypothetical protein
MYFHDKMGAFLCLLCRVFGVTPDTIKAIKDRNNRPRLTPSESAARVRGLIAS